MRIAVNTRLLLKGKLEGIGWFTNELLMRVVKNNPDHEFIFFFDRPYHEDFIYAPNVKPVVLSPQARHPFLYYIWFEWQIARALKKYKSDIFFSPDGQGSLRSKIPNLIAFHDLAYLHYPEYMDKMHKWHFTKFFPKYAQKATEIIAVSEYTKQDIIHNYKIPEDKIHIIYNGVNKAYRPISREEKLAVKQQYTDGCEYFIFTSALHPRKNVINLLKAFVKFKRRHRTKMKLVMVGRMAWQTNEIEEAKNYMPFKEDVIWLGYVDVTELSKLTAAAYAMVYPSKFEGFGIPIAESLACNIPVITSNVSSMPEVGGDAALYVDPNSPDDIADKMGIMYKDEELRNKLIANSKIQITKFDWDKSAAALWKLMLKCAKSISK